MLDYSLTEKTDLKNLKLGDLIPFDNMFSVVIEHRRKGFKVLHYDGVVFNVDDLSSNATILRFKQL
jgi:hypothetical protein